MLILYKPWDSQPQEAVGPSIEAVAAGLSSLTVFAGNDRVEFGSHTITRAGSGHVQSATTLGMGMSAGGTGRWTVSNPPQTIAPPSSSSFAVLLSLQLNSTGQANKYALYQRLASNNQTAILYGYTANSFEFYSTGYSGTDPRTGSAIVVSDTGAHTLLYTYNGATYEGWLDGVRVFSVARTFAISSQVPNEASILDALGANTLNATILTHATFSRGLPNDLAKLFTSNPWQLFEPQRIYIPVSASSAGSYTLNLESGSYTITGSDATLLHGYLTNLASGTYTLSGADATLLKNSLLNLESGSYTISGSDITFELAKVMDMESGSYSLTGSDITVLRTYQLNATSGSYTLTGQDVTFVYSGASNTVTIKAGSWLRYRIIQ